MCNSSKLNPDAKMSIYFEFEVGPRGWRFRRAVDADKYDIESFWCKEHTAPLFGDVDIGRLIELSTLAICLLDENKDVAGFMALWDRPNVPAIDPGYWEIWMRDMFNKYYLARSTLFIHFMCCMPEVIDYFMKEALISVFRNDVYLQTIVLVVPPYCSQDVILRYKTFKHHSIQKYHALANLTEEYEQGLHIYVAKRQEFCPKLKIRRGVEGDNDEIVEILDRHSSRLKEMYGEFYISEIIGGHSGSQRKIIVSESRDCVNGVMCLNATVNYRKLQKTYELQPYHWLIKATPLEREQYKQRNCILQAFGHPIMDGKWRPFRALLQLEDYKEEYSDRSKESASRKSSSKVNFAITAARRSFDHIYFRTEQNSDDLSEKSATESLSRSTEWSELHLLDEDPFDYDIINIDPSLFAFSCAMAHDKNDSRPELTVNKAVTDLPSASVTSPPSMKAKIRRHSSLTFATQEDAEPVHCAGDENAFCIELFGTSDDFDDKQAFDFLEAAFEIMKDKDYCIIRVPCTGNSLSLLQHFCFVPTKQHICSDYALYIAHRSSVMGKLRVRKAELADVPQISTLLLGLEGKESMWTVENCIHGRHEYVPYVLLSGLTVVGVAIVEPSEQADFLCAKLNVDPYHNHKHYLGGQGAGFATLLSALVYPVFEPHFRFFLRDVMRHAGAGAVVWLTAYRNKWVAHKANSMAGAMVPVLPRKSEIDCTPVKQLTYINALADELIPFSTWFLSRKLTSIPIVSVDTRIVIVGASRTAMGFLNTLLFSDASTYLTFTSVTLISPGGLSHARRPRPPAARMFPRFRTADGRHLKATPYTYYVNAVQGKVVGINQQKKYVELHHDKLYHYDMLFLLFGKPFQHPDYLKVVFDKYEQEKIHGPAPYQSIDTPRQERIEMQILKLRFSDNVFAVNDMATASKALDFVKAQQALGNRGKVLVYGACIHAYCCISALLESEIAAENIVFIEPFPHEDPRAMRVPVFCNVYVDQTVREVLASRQIQVYSSYYFESWKVGAMDRVTHVDFISHFQRIRLECAAFFYYGKKGIDIHAFTAISKSGIPYDGGILIEPEFRTKDPAIYAAGPVTRYHRRHFGHAMRHKHYDSYEVGEKLGIQIRNQLDPLFKPSEPKHDQSEKSKNYTESESCSNGLNSVNLKEGEKLRKSSESNQHQLRFPHLTGPKVIHCVLPGNLYYLEVRPPGKRIPHHYLHSLDLTGIVMETFKQGYFKLHLSDDLIVDGVTCLTSDSRNLDNFKNLYGLSAVVLNNVHLRYGAKKVDDFYSFFRAPWALFLYHDHKKDVLDLTKELLPKDCKTGETLTEMFRSTTNDTSTLDSKRTLLESRHQHMEAITSFVLEWVSENELLLPMYMQPHLRVDYEHDIGRNPVFRRRKRRVKDMLKGITEV